MKRFFKIFGAVLGGLVGFVVLVAAVLVYVVFTPKQLTPVVDKVAGEFISCDYEIGQVDLTFFSTFPEFGLRADGLLIVNPTEGAQSDTLLEAKRVVARIELMQLLCDGVVNVREVALQEVTLNPYIGAEGQTNFDVLTLSSDSTEEDTISGSFIQSVQFEDLRLTLDAKQISLVDEQDTLSAQLHDATISLTAKGEEKVCGQLSVTLPQLTASYKGTDYATNAKILLKAPYEMDLQMEGLSDIQYAKVNLHDASLALNEFAVEIEGSAEVIPAIDVDLSLRTNTWHIADFLQLVPSSIFTMPEDITADGYLRLEVVVQGEYNDSTMPLIDAHLTLNDATGEYAGLPYVLEDVQALVDAHVDLNNEALTAADIRFFSAKTKQSSVTGSGRVEDLLNSMLLDLALNVKLHLPDAAYFLPDGMVVNGKAEGPLFLKITLDDLSEVRLKKGVIKGDLAIRDLDAAMDSMTVSAKKAQLTFNIPNTRKAAAGNKQAAERRKHLDLLDGCLRLSNLEFEQMGSMTAYLGETDIDLQVSDILSNDPVIYADLDVETSRLDGTMLMTDSLGRVQNAVVKAEKPNICAYVEYDTKDTLRIPTLACTFAMQKLAADYDTIHAHISAPKGEASISGGRRDKTQPRIKAKIKADDVDAKMGSEVSLQTGLFDVAIAARHTNNKENILLEWQPKLDFHLQKAKAELAALEPTVKIPEIKFSYSNKDFKIDTSRVELGHSDFSLSGEIRNIGAYLANQDILEGTLNFYSSHADINELMGYVSGLGSDEEALAEEEKTLTPEEKAADPFLVPVGIDMTLNTYITEADAFDQHLRNLGGQVYVRDGVLIIEEMGFICEAARLQLTGMYKTPRKNHIFAGFDYHMTDINVEELVNMIPQVDSMLPMLRSFKGAANFHLAAETYMNAKYEIKPSTTRGAMSIDAKDLTLLDGETFTKIAKILTFKKKTENKIDSISAEISLYKQQIDIYPFLISCDKWMGAVGGQHYLDMSFDYHVNLLSPLYIGVGVKGTFDDLSIKPEKCIYAKDFRPVLSKKVDTQAADIRKMIKQALEKNIKK